MLKHRIIIVVLSIAVIIILYFLPRIVVNNEKNREIGITSEESGTESGTEGIEKKNHEIHAMEISGPDQNRIDNYRQIILKEGPELTALADSLSRIFMKYNQYDSAAKYLEIIASDNPGLEEYERVGNAYYNALGFALEKTKADYFAEKARYYYHIILNKDPETSNVPPSRL